ncbi:SHOCT domain-containing protein [Demequina sediminis]|nr:SHOCT domain-containing protein [Demequina sediminis]BDZ60296.1 hypothetical protein GCM10025873_00870 [Demequina sediminis]
MARTAVISGTAQAVSGNVARGQHARWEADAQGQQSQAAPQAAAPVAPVAPAGDDLMAQLTQLAQMHAAGILTEAEFAAAKATLLS